MKMIGSWESGTYKADSEEFYNKLILSQLYLIWKKHISFDKDTELIINTRSEKKP